MLLPISNPSLIRLPHTTCCQYQDAFPYDDQQNQPFHDSPRTPGGQLPTYSKHKKDEKIIIANKQYTFLK